MLGHSVLSGAVSTALSVIRGKGRLATSDLREMARHFSTEPGRRVLESFGGLVRKRKIWADPDAMADELAMKPAQRQMLRLLCGEDVLLSGQAVVRVAARVAGSESHRINRMTNGRIDIARLVGAGDEAPLRTAALRLMGSMICREHQPVCEICPLRKHCAFRRNGYQDPTDDQVSLFAAMPEPRNLPDHQPPAASVAGTLLPSSSGN
jgi:DNA (cytosine-5)-methyltransferase 1